ncbi:MAG: 50S ribosomal protein L1 [Candidatus Omnitrophica bacterium]|nr:50S ribosomal protein L1 [Candidatus Omnitrophota bacterium]
MKRISKRLKEGYKAVDREKTYTLEEAIAALESFPKVKFDETVEIHFDLGINPKASDQIVRGTVVLPHGTGKSLRIAVFCKGENEAKAKGAGADFVGAEELIDKVSKGFLDFDVVVATPDMMRELSKLGKVLGPRGLMPTPKAGTVTPDVVKAISELKAGKIEFKSDKQAGVHLGVGKRSFSKDKLADNIRQILDAINLAKPNTLKGTYIKSASLTTTMGPGLKVAI